MTGRRGAARGRGGIVLGTAAVVTLGWTLVGAQLEVVGSVNGEERLENNCMEGKKENNDLLKKERKKEKRLH